MSAWLRCVIRQPVEPRGWMWKCDANVSPRTHPLSGLQAFSQQSTETHTITHDPPASRSVRHDLDTDRTHAIRLGFVELCAKILQIMRNDFKDYARTFCQLFLPLAKNLFRFSTTHSRIQDRPILCLCDRQNSLPPSSTTSDFLYCLARSATLTLAES